MDKKLFLVAGMAGFALVALLAAGPPGVEPAKGPPPRKIPGITADDPYPNACVDCHIHYEDMKLDTRFSTLLQQWGREVEPKLLAQAQASAPMGMTLKGRHPPVAGAVLDVPAKCLVCHGKASKTSPPFASMIHSIHLTGGPENHFVTLFQGECTYCHKLEMSTGRWRIPSAPQK